MASPKPLSRTVLVRHPKFGERTVQRSQLGQLSSRWERVPVVERIQRRPARRKAPVEAPPIATEPPAPGADKED